MNKINRRSLLGALAALPFVGWMFKGEVGLPELGEPYRLSPFEEVVEQCYIGSDQCVTVWWTHWVSLKEPVIGRFFTWGDVAMMICLQDDKGNWREMDRTNIADDGTPLVGLGCPPSEGWVDTGIPVTVTGELIPPIGR